MVALGEDLEIAELRLQSSDCKVPQSPLNLQSEISNLQFQVD